MEIRHAFMHFRQRFALLLNSRVKKAVLHEKSVSVERRRRRWRLFLKKNWAYVLAFIASFLLSLVIIRLG